MWETLLTRRAVAPASVLVLAVAIADSSSRVHLVIDSGLEKSLIANYGMMARGTEEFDWGTQPVLAAYKLL